MIKGWLWKFLKIWLRSVKKNIIKKALSCARVRRLVHRVLSLYSLREQWARVDKSPLGLPRCYPPRTIKRRTPLKTELQRNCKMEVGMSLNALVRLPLSNTRTSEGGLVKHSLSSSTRATQKLHQRQQKNIFVVQAKGKKGMQARQFQRPPPLALPKIEDDGNPKFVIFIRMANVCYLSSLELLITMSFMSLFFLF